MIEKFTAIVGQDQDETGQRTTELVVRRSVWAGVDGPLFTREIAWTGDLDAVDEVLRAEGFLRNESWTIHQTCSGMSLEAELVRR